MKDLLARLILKILRKVYHIADAHLGLLIAFLVICLIMIAVLAVLLYRMNKQEKRSAAQRRRRERTQGADGSTGAARPTQGAAAGQPQARPQAAPQPQTAASKAKPQVAAPQPQAKPQAPARRHRISYVTVSHPGKLRPNNQDNFYCGGKHMEIDGTGIEFPLHGVISSDRPEMIGIFDGMGGEQCGETASYLAARTATELQIGADPAAEMKAFCQKANMRIVGYAKRNHISSMGTTAAMLAFSERMITVCNIGDSKVFRYAAGMLTQISMDHLEIVPPGMKAPLSQCLGIDPEDMVIQPYAASAGYQTGDIYLICSDGLTDMVSNEQITRTLAESDFEDACELLLLQALQAGGRDNTTIILARVE